MVLIRLGAKEEYVQKRSLKNTNISNICDMRQKYMFEYKASGGRLSKI